MSMVTTSSRLVLYTCKYQAHSKLSKVSPLRNICTSGNREKKLFPTNLWMKTSNNFIQGKMNLLPSLFLVEREVIRVFTS